MNNSDQHILEVKDLKVHFSVGNAFKKKKVKAVDGVSFELKHGEILGLAGESGCGKSTLARALLGIVETTSGSITIAGEEQSKKRHAVQKTRKLMQMVFQDPNDSLNPRMKIGPLIDEALRVRGIPRSDRPLEVQKLLQLVGLPKEFALRYPHELSGGQRQRIGIARAIAIQPVVIVSDEPTSALDVSVRAQIVNLLKDLQTRLNLGQIFISHDLALMRHISDRVAVMYLGRIVEIARSEDFYRKPLHPYTQVLLESVLTVTETEYRSRPRLLGDVPSPINVPSGCSFHPRCPLATDRCKNEVPKFEEAEPGHMVACHYPQMNVWKEVAISANDESGS